MTRLLGPLLAAEGMTRETFEWGRIQSDVRWWMPVGLFLVACVCVAILVFVRTMYAKDSREIHPVLGWFLTALRSLAFLALLVLFLDPRWRTEREITRPSRVLFLVDTSLSMLVTDVPAPGSAVPVSRARQVVDALDNTDLLEQLRKTHEVVVWRFDQDLKRVAPLDRLKAQAQGAGADPPEGAAGAEAGPAGKDETKPASAKVVWADLLLPPDDRPPEKGRPAQGRAPYGNETRLGQNLKQLIANERSAPLAGVVVVSDGGQNAGVSPDAAAELAREAKVPVFAIGVGSDRKPANVRVSDLIAPARAYPGDRFTVTAYVQAQEMAEQRVTVELLSRAAASGPSKEAGTGQLEDSRQIILGTDGEVLPLKFEIAPSEPGRRVYCVRVQPPKTDGDPADNFREADVDVVDRKNKVLVVAGGPTREYQFLRNLLYRDKSTTVDVYLQTAQPGVSQEADQILDDFPSLREELYEYDCVVAFDPDWRAIGPGAADVLESWVAEQGGGLVLVAGPVHMGETVGGWVDDASMAKVQALYPVEFIRRLTVGSVSDYTAEEPWPLEFTRAGLEADYLWLADTASASQAVWSEFKGVYSFFPVRGAKPGATVLARFSDPRSGAGTDGAPYFVTHFYGSGRVFYLGSGEMWRLRAVDDTHFEQFYTKLIRHVSQGRLLRGSTRGVLLVGQEQYQLGNTVEVRAQLSNAQMQPLERPEGVSVQVMHQESGAGQALTLLPDPARLGTFSGQFTVLKEGTYRLELPVPDSADERLAQTVKVRIPKLESETPQRNDAVLSRIAKATEGGEYYLGFDEAVSGAGDKKPLAEMVKDMTRTTVVLETPNNERKEFWLTVILAVLCVTFFLEWTIRRLVRLA